jgi:hypothetical protein
MVSGSAKRKAKKQAEHGLLPDEADAKAQSLARLNEVTEPLGFRVESTEDKVEWIRGRSIKSSLRRLDK